MVVTTRANSYLCSATYLNYPQLAQAYGGPGLPTALEAALQERLRVYEVGQNDLLIKDHCVLIRFSSSVLADTSDKSVWAETLCG